MSCEENVVEGRGGHDAGQGPVENEHHQGQDLHLGPTGAQVPASRKGPSSVGAPWFRPSQPGPPTWGP